MASTDKTVDLEAVKGGEQQQPPPPPPPRCTGGFNLFIIDVTLRGLLFAASVISLVVLVTADETKTVMPGVVLKAKFEHSPAFMVFVLMETVELSSASNSIEIGDYFASFQVLRSTHLSFKDVQLFLFKPNLSLLFNLIGAHYCIFHLHVPASDVIDALVRCEISERQVCVKWWKLGRLFYGFRMRDESHSRWVSLADLLTEDGKEVLGVLHRGAVYEVLRVEITTSNATTSFWHHQLLPKLSKVESKLNQS